MSMLPIPVKDYSDGRTKQSFKDSTDINKILKRAQKQGSLAHVQKYPEAVYGEFENYDLLEAHNKVDRARTIFADLPSEVRNEFDNDPFRFAGFASNPANRGKLIELLPAIAEPGPYFPNPVKQGAEGAGAATAPATQSEAASATPSAPEAPAEGSTSESGSEGG